LHQSAYDKMRFFVERYLLDYINIPLKILDVGSCVREFQASQKKLFDYPKWNYVGLDIEEGNNVDIVVKEPYDWVEIKSNSFDVVISNQTFEHIPYFWVTTLEIGRVLKDGGLACIIAPSSGGEHRFPIDTFRYYPDGFGALCEYIGFKKIETYRQDVDLQYPDGADPLKDCCLIMQKPVFSDSERENFLVKNKLHKILLKRIYIKDLDDIKKDIVENIAMEKSYLSRTGKSCLYNIKPKNAFLELERERLSKISEFFVRKRIIKACIPILINNIFGKKAAKIIFKIYPKMEYWS